MAEVKIYIPTDSAQLVVDDTANLGVKEKTYTTAAHTYMETNNQTIFTVKDLADNEQIMSAPYSSIQNEAGDLTQDFATVEAYLLSIIGS